LAGIVRQKADQSGRQYLVYSIKEKSYGYSSLKKREPLGSLANIGAIELPGWGTFVGYGAMHFERDFCDSLLELYGPFNGPFGETLKTKFAFAMSTLMKNAIVHGNHGDAAKKIIICFDRIESGFMIDVYDEGKGSLFLFNRSSGFREFALWFRFGYGGQNIGTDGVRQDFGQDSLTATKIYNELGKRVGTRVRLTVNLSELLRCWQKLPAADTLPASPK
jgi:hypothetical protein